MKRTFIALALVILLGAVALQSQTPDWAARLENDFKVVPDVTYLTATSYDAKLDLYLRRNVTTPQPTMIFIHGGGWFQGTKEGSTLAIQPYLAMGLNVVNVEYRLAKVALAPAAVEDCRCALQWVISRAKEYGIDPQRIVIAGDSAGGHLALTTGFLPASVGLDRECARNPYIGPDAPAGDMKVAAVINWYGIADVNELLDGPNMKPWAVTWFGAQPNREEIARRVSPLTYIRAGLPPVLTIHGDEDPSVPYSQSVQLHKRLSEVGVPNELLTMPGGKHGIACCNLDQRTNVYRSIQAFLRKHGVLRKGE